MKRTMISLGLPWMAHTVAAINPRYVDTVAHSLVHDLVYYVDYYSIVGIFLLLLFNSGEF